MYRVDEYTLYRDEIPILVGKDAPTELLICENWESGILYSSERINFYVTEFCFTIFENENRYYEIKSMMNKGEINIELCDHVWYLYRYVVGKSKHINSMIYDYVQPQEATISKFKNYKGITVTDGNLFTNITWFRISDEFTSLLKSGISCKVGLASIYEQISEVLSVKPMVKSARKTSPAQV